MGELVAIRCDPDQAGPALRRVWDAGDAALFLPRDAPATAIAAVVAGQRPHRLLDLLADGPGAAPTRLPGPLTVADGIALVVISSGSTGVPKGVELDHAALHASTQLSIARLGCRPDERWALALPTHHIAGVQVLLRSWALGTDARVVDDLAALATCDAQYVSLVPTQLGRLLDAGVDVARFATILLGGARAEPALLTRAQAAGGRVVVSYGMSETCGGCVYDGVPLDDVEVALDRGRIHLRGPNLFRGYRPAVAAAPVAAWRGRSAGALSEPPPAAVGPDTSPSGRERCAGAPSQPPDRAGPPATAPADPPATAPAAPPATAPAGPAGDPHAPRPDDDPREWFRTGDLGRFDADGRLEVLGRADDVIISGGENVPMGAVEALLRGAPGVADVAVIGRRDPDWGEIIVAIVVARDPAAPLHLDDLRNHVRANAPAAYAPRQLVVVDTLPRDAMGKLGSATLRRLAEHPPRDGA